MPVPVVWYDISGGCATCRRAWGGWQEDHPRPDFDAFCVGGIEFGVGQPASRATLGTDQVRGETTLQQHVTQGSSHGSGGRGGGGGGGTSSEYGSLLPQTGGAIVPSPLYTMAGKTGVEFMAKVCESPTFGLPAAAKSDSSRMKLVRNFFTAMANASKMKRLKTNRQMASQSRCY